MARAQVEARPELNGRVLLGDSAVAGTMVVLHRVSADSAGELDSLKSGPDGTFRFRLPSVPDPSGAGDIYFASVRHAGVLYFGPALTRAIQLDSVYTIQAYDTMSVAPSGATLPVGVRYLIFDPGADGSWQVTDLFEIENQENRTLVARDSGATWSHPLPPSAHSVELGGGDPSGPRVVGSVLSVGSPISPGTRQFVVRYTVASLDSLRIPVAAATSEIELLVREPAPSLDIAGLTGVESVEMEPGVTYRRYGGSLPADTAIVLTLGKGPTQIPMEWLAVLLALLLAGAALYALQRNRASAPTGSVAGPSRAAPPGAGQAAAPVADTRQRLILEVAKVDQSLASQGLSPREARRLEARRADLMARLRELG